jgi:hypothetical protein
MTDMDLRHLDMASDISINEASYYWVSKGWIQKFDNLYRYHNGTINSTLISGKVYSIHMTYMDLRYLDMASDISINEASY